MDRDHPGYSMNDAKLQEHRISVSRCCPSCGHKLDCMPDMVGLPVGVKFDPTDQELIEHLETKVMDGGSRAHPLIEDFIPTMQGEDGICYTHPEKLPGVTRNGQSKHFFHRSPKAYTTGTRKRRKIQAQGGGQPNSKNSAKTRWHKTGKTRPLMVDSRQKGCKKILVLYTSFGKHRKPEKTNWVMHQYHLGGLDDEKEGELIVSKVFYQTQTRQGVAGTAATLDECARDGNMEEETAATQIGIIGAYTLAAAAAAAAAAAVEEQRQQLKQDDEQFSYAAVPKKRLHELQVGADHEVAVDQAEEQHRHHHRPSQHHVSPNLQEMSLPGTNALATASQPQSLISAIHPVSVNLNNNVPNSTMLLANGNFQRPPARQCKETQWRYKTSQPDNRDQHG